MARKTNAELTEATRIALIAAGRRLFSERGYAATSTEEIVASAGVTRGALYHHFPDKGALFRAVYEVVEAEVASQVSRAATSGDGDALQRLERGVGAFLSACLDPDVQQIVLLDGLSTLGWEAWLEIDSRYGLGQLKAAVEFAIRTKQIACKDASSLAHLLFGALMQAGLVVARAKSPQQARKRMLREMTRMIAGLRVAPADG